MAPFDLGIGQGAALALVLLGAAFVRGYSGFGFSALVVAGGGLFMNPLFLVPVVILCELAMTLVQGRAIASLIDWRRVGAMFIGAAIAMPVSIWALARIGTDPARLAISVLILGMCVILLAGWTLTRRIGVAGHAGVGVVSGLANGAAVGGLPVAAFMAAQPIPAAVFRATMVAYLTAIDLIALPLMWGQGLISRDTGLVFALSLPLLLVGLVLGGRHFLAASPQDFRRMTIWLLAALATLGIVKSLV